MPPRLLETDKSANANPVCMRLAARRALHLERVPERLVLGVVWPEVGDPGVRRNTLSSGQSAWRVERQQPRLSTVGVGRTPTQPAPLPE